MFQNSKKPRCQKKRLFAKDFAIFEGVQGRQSLVPQRFPGLGPCKKSATARDYAE